MIPGSSEQRGTDLQSAALGFAPFSRYRTLTYAHSPFYAVWQVTDVVPVMTPVALPR